jgi:hypothetical protein
MALCTVYIHSATRFELIEVLNKLGKVNVKQSRVTTPVTKVRYWWYSALLSPPLNTYSGSWDNTTPALTNSRVYG